MTAAMTAAVTATLAISLTLLELVVLRRLRIESPPKLHLMLIDDVVRVVLRHHEGVGRDLVDDVVVARVLRLAYPLVLHRAQWLLQFIFVVDQTVVHFRSVYRVVVVWNAQELELVLVQYLLIRNIDVFHRGASLLVHISHLLNSRLHVHYVLLHQVRNLHIF